LEILLLLLNTPLYNTFSKNEAVYRKHLQQQNVFEKNLPTDGSEKVMFRFSWWS